jgi:hypothetical protein
MLAFEIGMGAKQPGGGKWAESGMTAFETGNRGKLPFAQFQATNPFCASSLTGTLDHHRLLTLAAAQALASSGREPAGAVGRRSSKRLARAAGC